MLSKTFCSKVFLVLIGFSCGFLMARLVRVSGSLPDSDLSVHSARSELRADNARGAGSRNSASRARPGDTRPWTRERAMLELERVAGLPSWSKDRKRQRYEIFRNWMLVDPTAALACFHETTSPEDFVIYHPKLFEDLFESDRIAALDYVVELKGKTGISIDISGVLEKWPKEDRDLLDDFCRRLGKSANGALAVESLIEDMVEYDSPDVGWEWILANTSGSMKDRAVNRYFTRLALVDPDEAYRRLADVPENMLNQHLLPEIGKGMAEVDIDKALVWYATLPESRQKPKVYWEIMAKHITNDPEKASLAVAQLPEGDLKSDLMMKLAWTMGDRDLGEAFKWIQRQEWTPSTWRAYQNLTEQWARKDPIATISFLMENADPAAKNRLLPGAIEPLIENAFDQALPIIKAMPEGSIQDSAIESYCAKLYATNPEQAKAWLDGIEHGRFRDVASQGVVENALASNPEFAAQIACGIGESRKRLDLLKMSVTDIALRNPGRAVKLLDSLAISAADKAEVLANLPPSNHGS